MHACIHALYTHVFPFKNNSHEVIVPKKWVHGRQSIIFMRVMRRVVDWLNAVNEKNCHWPVKLGFHLVGPSMFFFFFLSFLSILTWQLTLTLWDKLHVKWCIQLSRRKINHFKKLCAEQWWLFYFFPKLSKGKYSGHWVPFSQTLPLH